MKKALIGYQVYSAREEASKDLLGTLKQLKALGYDGVEFAGFYGHTAEEVKEMLDEAGLVAFSDHVPFALIEKDMFGVIRDHLTIGCKYIAVPYLDEAHRPGQPGFADVIRTIVKFGRLCREAGIQLLYHNHDFEFQKISGMYALDFLYAAVDPEFLKTEIDTCWVDYSGENPADYIRKYAGRAPIVHMKDFVGSRGGTQPYALIKADGSDDGKNSESTTFEFRPVGYGCQDVKSIVEAGLDAGAFCFVVEQDQWYDRTPFEAAKMSVDTLRKLGL